MTDERHRLLIESWTQAIWETDAAGVVVADSPSWRAYTGQSLKEWLGYGWLDAIHPDDRAYAEKQWREAMAARRVVDAEFRLRAPGGGWRWTNVRAAPVLDTSGNIEKWVGVNIDIGARKRTEAELRESEERQAYFLALSDALRPLADKEEIQATAMRLLGEKLNLNRAQYYIADETGEYLSSTGGYSNGIPAAIGNYRLIEFGKYAYDGFHAGETQVLCDANIDPRISAEVLRSYKEVGFMAFIGVPFVQRGRLVGTLAVHQSEPRQWTVSERMMVEETAERTGIAVEQARAEAALRQNQERQAFLLKLSDAMRAQPDVAAITKTATSLVADQLGLDRAYVCRVSRVDDLAVIEHETRQPGLPSAEGEYALSSFPTSAARLEVGPLVYSDIATDPAITELDRQSMLAMGFGALICTPLRKGATDYIWTLTVGMSRARQWSDHELRLLEETAERTWGAIERARAEAALRESEERFQQFADASSDTLWIRDAVSLSMEYVSAAFAAMYGVGRGENLDGVEHWAALIVPEDRDQALAALDAAKESHATVTEFRIRRPSDGAFRWIRNTTFPLQDGQGQVRRIGGLFADITEARLSTEHQKVLLAELQHRVRNIMAMIRSVATQTGVTAASVEDYTRLIGGRLMALARTQTLLTRAANEGVEIRRLIGDELQAQAHDGGQYVMTGPELVVSPKAAEVLSLAIHELATNALKYGALSVPGGKVSVAWQVSGGDQARLHLDWTENRPAPAGWTPPSRRGFGSELLEQRVPYELGGVGRIAVRADGLDAMMEFPLRPGASILETDAPTRTSVFGGSIDMAGEPSLAGQTVLILEDDFYLARDTVGALRGAGADVVGPFPTEVAAIAALRAQAPTAGVIDINLGQGPSFETARALRKSGRPFLFLTGYDTDVIPPEFADVVCLQKPVELRDIVRAVAALAGRATAC